ncbi:MAG TPA: hypothetical protein VLX64_06320 [Thermoplasmata archaeon]|nr:hypothetical protein [Thermoplasmata archaeon]HUJ78605.1 hypothetical protein [Thermoplasmata archaeon]
MGPLLYLPALAVAIVITVTEMTEVVAIVFALGTEGGSIRPGAVGAVLGASVVGGFAVASGWVLLALPRTVLLGASAIVLAGFAAFLFRSTVRSYRRALTPGGPARAPRHLAFAGGFSVGAIEAVEAVIVLLALAAAGYGVSALVGALVGGGALAAAAAVLHERIRRIKGPVLKLAATSMLATFATFWGGEAAGVPWPLGDATLVPLFVAALLVVRGLVALALRPGPALPVGT